MPRLDGTGPLGQGKMTGYAMGNCEGARRTSSYTRGRGWGMGCRRFFHSPKNQIQSLEKEEKMLIEELELIRSEKEALKGQK